MKTNPMKWRTIKSEIALDGSPHIVVKKETVLTHTGEKIYPWYKIADSDFVVVVPITSTQEIIMVEQYRHGADRISLELPAGSMDQGETPIAAAARELQEETGYKAKSFKKLGKRIFEDPALKTSSFEILVGLNVDQVSEQMLDATEEIKVVRKPFHQAISMAINGDIISPASITGILWAAFYLGKVYHIVT